MWRCILLAVLLLAVVARGEYEEEDIYEYADDEPEDRAFLVIQRKVLEKEISDGMNVTLVLTIFNAGTRCVCPL